MSRLEPGTCYVERQGHCTRCVKVLADNEAAHMVRDKVGWNWMPQLDCFMGHRWSWVVVCETCLKPAEAAQNRLTRECPGCELNISTPHRYGCAAVDVCSDACRQRVYRKEHRFKKLRCDECSNEFTAARRDSNYCCNACRQAAYRNRKTKTAEIAA